MLLQEKITEVPVESEASKKHLALVQAEVKELSAALSKVKAERQSTVDSLHTQHKWAANVTNSSI